MPYIIPLPSLHFTVNIHYFVSGLNNYVLVEFSLRGYVYMGVGGGEYGMLFLPRESRDQVPPSTPSLLTVLTNHIPPYVFFFFITPVSRLPLSHLHYLCIYDICIRDTFLMGIQGWVSRRCVVGGTTDTVFRQACNMHKTTCVCILCLVFESAST